MTPIFCYNLNVMVYLEGNSGVCSHDNGLRVIAEVFAEKIYTAFMNGVVFDSDCELNIRFVERKQVCDRQIFMDELIIHKNAGFIDGDRFKDTELRARNGPVFGGVFAAPSAEIAGRSEREDFFFIYKDGYVARPVVVVTVCFRTDFERKSQFRNLTA